MLEQVLANPRGVEILIDETAAEEEQIADLDSAGVGSRAGRDLDRSRGEGNALIDRAASADHRAGSQALVSVKDVVAGRAVERTGQGRAALRQPRVPDDR